jgi:hypothetical protein
MEFSLKGEMMKLDQIKTRRNHQQLIAQRLIFSPLMDTIIAIITECMHAPVEKMYYAHAWCRMQNIFLVERRACLLSTNSEPD